MLANTDVRETAKKRGVRLWDSFYYRRDRSGKAKDECRCLTGQGSSDERLAQNKNAAQSAGTL